MSEVKTLIIEAEARSRLVLMNTLNGLADIHVVGAVSSAMQLNLQAKQRKPNILTLVLGSFDEPSVLRIVEFVQNSGIAVLALSQGLLPTNSAERALMKLPSVRVLRADKDAIASRDPAFIASVEKALQHSAASLPVKPAPGIVKQQDSSESPKVAASLHRAMLDTVIALGASTGGTEALKHVISAFPQNAPAVLIVQHLPSAFAASFIDKLNQSTAMKVVPAVDGVAVHKGHIYVGASDQHFRIEKMGMGFVCRLKGSERLSGHCPSVNELFDSVAMHAGSKAIGALMTGMGEDGATGLKRMVDVRAKTIAQDQKSSVVWGMPGTAVRLGAAQEQVSLHDIGARIMQLVGHS